MTIYFYSTTDKYGYLTNFSRHGFHLDGKHWPTVEHYFQAQKFSGTEYEERVRRATTPREAKRLGNDRSRPLRSDWGQVKDDVMKRAIMSKFEAHDEIRGLLLGTGDEELVEDAPRDYYWGCGADGTGKNMLGKILMEVRSVLRDREARLDT